MRKLGSLKSFWTRDAKEVSTEATVTAVGLPWATSFAKEGPLSAATLGLHPQNRPTTSSITSVMRRRVSFSMPLVALTKSICGNNHWAMCSKVRRQWCEGITLTTISAPASASWKLLVALTGDGSGQSGRNKVLVRACAIAWHTSLSSAHSLTS
jgi:hypothetical protein